MGRGDNLLATGLARGARDRGKRIAFGPANSRKTHWDGFSPEIFRGNPNIAAPGTEHQGDVEWIDFRQGHRIYNKSAPGRWLWNMSFRAKPGQLYFEDRELAWAEKYGSRFVLMEPNVEQVKTWAPNKQWPVERYAAVAADLASSGFEIVQFLHPATKFRIPRARVVAAPNFRHALALLKRAALYIGSEGGMHHGAAAVDVPGVVLFGGFIPPSVMGYSTHINLTGGANACGSWRRCAHCLQAMQRIEVEDVVVAAEHLLAGQPIKETAA